MTPPKDKAAPVVIIKKRAHHAHAHHGGAWKVAYADFVTAMMAFFLVMWLVAQGPQVRGGVAAYFRDPGAFADGRGVLPGAEAGAMGGGQPGFGRTMPETPDIAAARRALEKAAEHLRQIVESKFSSIQSRIEITVTDEGLRIELSDAPDDGFFPSGSAAMKPATEQLLAVIGAELGHLNNPVAVEGHTDSRPYSTTTGYTNWELSADRANAARRVLEASGIRPSQMEGVRGYGPKRPRLPENPLDARNRRISIVVRHFDPLPPQMTSAGHGGTR